MTNEQFLRWLDDPDRQPLVMGVLNVTPDSFSDGGQLIDASAAAELALRMAQDGAAIIDIGGESTRPGAQRVPAEEQIRRIVPVLKALEGHLPAVISVDTTRAEVARAALDHGAFMLNDISAGREDPDLLPLAAQHQAPVALMHMQGEPATMQLSPAYNDVVGEIGAFLDERAKAAQAAGLTRNRILVDPGIGFGKTIEHNLSVLRNLHQFATLGFPLLLGTSRKGFLGRITGESEPGKRLMGTAASVAWCVANGAAIVRVHDVAAMVKVVRVVDAIKSGRVR